MPVVPGPPAATPPPASPCEAWTAELPCAPDGTPPELIADALTVASELVWGFSGRRFGPSCPIHLRPCLRSCVPDRLAHSGSWYSCDLRGAVLPLPRPVYAVDAVLIDGAVFTDWLLDDGNLLRRTDGLQWPARQDLDLPATEPGTFDIELRIGEPIPASGIRAVQTLACEYVALWTATGKCRLPARARNVSRAGVTVELIDPAEFLVNQRLGVWEVDSFLELVNPSGLSSRSSVLSPDSPMYRRR